MEPGSRISRISQKMGLRAALRRFRGSIFGTIWKREPPPIAPDKHYAREMGVGLAGAQHGLNDIESEPDGGLFWLCFTGGDRVKEFLPMNFEYGTLLIGLASTWPLGRRHQTNA